MFLVKRAQPQNHGSRLARRSDPAQAGCEKNEGGAMAPVLYWLEKSVHKLRGGVFDVTYDKDSAIAYVRLLQLLAEKFSRILNCRRYEIDQSEPRLGFERLA